MTMIDLKKLKRDLRHAALECSGLKRILRQRWTAPMADTQRALVRARRRSTELCILRAHLRGRCHLSRPHAGDVPSDLAAYQSRIAARVAADYALEASAIVLEVG
jgi:hypothetical protein